MNRFFEFTRPQMVTLAVLAVISATVLSYQIITRYIMAPAVPVHAWKVEVLQDYRASLVVNINTAGQDSLELIPGIGPVLAERIVAYRNTNGPFSAIDSLVAVPGIGPVKLEALRKFIEVNIGEK